MRPLDFVESDLLDFRDPEIAEYTCHWCTAIRLARNELAASALRVMEEKRITSVLVVDAERRVEGVVHIHDLWTLQLF